jgi:hypothetical protein
MLMGRVIADVNGGDADVDIDADADADTIFWR